MKKNEEERFRICWNITSRCNENCEYCHRFMVDERSLKGNKKILKKMIKDGITNITWSGGEALLYKDVIKLMKIANKAGVHNKLITNGIVFSELEDKDKEELCKNLEKIVLSIDSKDDEINQELGRGVNHYETVKEVLDYVKDKDIIKEINTVVSKKSLNKVAELGEFLNNYNISTWKFFRFMPLRGIAEKNKEEFEVSNADVENTVKEIEKLKLDNINSLYYKTEELMEEDIVLNAQGDMFQSVRNKEGVFEDIYKGNAMTDNVIEVIKESRRKANQSNFRNNLKVNIKQGKNKDCTKYPQCCNGAHKKEEGKEPEIDD